MKKSFVTVGLGVLTFGIGLVMSPECMAQSRKIAAARVANDPKVQALSRQITLNPKSETLRRALAERYEELGLYPQASDAYAREAALQREKTKRNVRAAVATEQKARRYRTQVRLFQDRPATAEERNSLNTRARLEPPLGCYVGAFIDRDDVLKETYYDENFQLHRYPGEFQKVTARPHASYFMYVAYRTYVLNGVKREQQIPLKWLEQCKRDGIIPQISLEPHDFDEVRDDEYLRNYARTLGQLNWPIFVRFAAEMNGKWTKWSVDPATYRAKFRLVHQTLRRYAPKVATIWCPNSVPVTTIASYYPGDDGCDWVGVNLYCVPYYNNDPSRPASRDAPTTLLDPIYNLYASRKPIAIAEWGASRETRLLGKDQDSESFALQKMALFYDALPRLYPRVKMVNWFNMNALRHAPPGRQLNNYNLTEKSTFLAHYQRAIEEPYFIKALSNAPSPETPLPFPLKVGQIWQQPVSLSIWVQSVALRPLVALEIGDKRFYTGRSYGVHRVQIDPAQIPEGQQRLVVRVYDDEMRLLTTESTIIEVRRKNYVAAVPSPPVLKTPPKITQSPARQNGNKPKLPSGKAPSSATLGNLINQVKNQLNLPDQPKAAGTASPGVTVSSPAPDDVKLGDWVKQGESIVNDLNKQPLVLPGLPPILAPTAESNSVPVPVSGTVQRYYADDSGLVTAMQVQTPGSSELVYFPPILAEKIKENAPVGTHIETWLLPRAVAKATEGRAWDLAARGFSEPLAEPLAALWSDGKTLMTQIRQQNSKGPLTARGKVTGAVRDQNGRAVALILDKKTLVYVPARLRPSTANRLPNATTAPEVIIEVKGAGLRLPPGTLNLYSSVMEASSIRTQGRALSAQEWAKIDNMEWKPDPQLVEVGLGLEQKLLRLLQLQPFAGGIEDLLATGTDTSSPAEEARTKLSPRPAPEEIVTKTGQRPW